MSAPVQFVPVTDARQLRDRVSDMLAREVTVEQCRAAMHALGMMRYESLSSDDVGRIADVVDAGGAQ